MPATVIYGIPNCDTIKKARSWLDKQRIEYQFHDFRADGIEEKSLRQWAKAVGWETLLNRRGTTWRQLSDKEKDNVSEKKSFQLMLSNPTLIKRPVLVSNKKVYVGFKPAEYASIFK